MAGLRTGRDGDLITLDISLSGGPVQHLAMTVDDALTVVVALTGICPEIPVVFAPQVPDPWARWDYGPCELCGGREGDHELDCPDAFPEAA
jgi:hypothetical protein